MWQENAPSENRNEPTNRTKRTGATILVVEDFEETRSAIKLLLELRGYRVLEAVNGHEAVEIARRERPDLVLMDLSLPLLDGFAATRSIREETQLRDVPIVAVTAHATPDYRVKAFAAGCDEFVTKPIDFDKLGNLLSRLLRKASSATP